MTNANWGLQDWGAGTSYEPQGGFFQRGIDGSPTGLTQGAFQNIGAGLQGAGKAMMQPPGRPPGEMAMMGLANGANTWQKQQQQHQAQTQGMGQTPEGQQGGPMGGMGAFDLKSMLGLRSVPDMFKRFKNDQPGGLMGAFTSGGGQ
jgi:hypothetical protein